MVKQIIITAVMTGAFCSVFAVGIDWVTDMLDRQQVIVVSFTSGFLGSLFANGFMAWFGKADED